MVAKRVLAGAVLAVVVMGAALGAQPDPSVSPVPPDVTRIVLALRAMGDRLHVALQLATMGVLSPTQLDQRLYAGQVVNRLVGPEGEGFNPRIMSEGEFTGLLVEARSLVEFVPRAGVAPELRERLMSGLRRVLLLLTMARDEVQAALRARRLEVGAEHMLRAFAFLHAALGRESDPIYLGGVLALLRLLPPPPLPDSGP